jgi:hypothetical protein
VTRDGFYTVSLSANMSTRKFSFMVVILLSTLAACFPTSFLFVFDQIMGEK